ncbi:MAG: hypothetical protein IKZ87_04520, partial [Actinomycetaceae bacterium]|nr:hypothetical protein [Actinomycetaceae bacterium]
MSFASSLRTGLGIAKIGADVAVSSAKRFGEKIVNTQVAPPMAVHQPRTRIPSSFRAEFGSLPSPAFTPEDA